MIEAVRRPFHKTAAPATGTRPAIRAAFAAALAGSKTKRDRCLHSGPVYVSSDAGRSRHQDQNV
jgi:hypothetical protein